MSKVIIDNIIGIYQAKGTTPMTKPIIPTPQEFFNQIIALNDKLEVHQACNALLDALAGNYAVSTVSKKLTAYKELFYNHQHTNNELNETVKIKGGEKQQHIASSLLTLSDEQKQTLQANRSKADNARAGINDEGEFREIQKPATDIEKIVRKSLECLQSSEYSTIACGIINLTGLRASEQNRTKQLFDTQLFEHEMIVVGEYLLGFKGLSKKRNIDDVKAYFIRPTLVPANLIVNAQKKYLADPKVKALAPDYETYRKSGLRKAIERKYQELFGNDLSTIEAYDDSGKLINANGSLHKGRAFYACALRAILKAKGTRDKAIQNYIQLSLAHDSITETVKYLGRYDETDFCNPIDVNIAVNIKELGKMSVAVIEEIKTPETTEEKPVKTIKDTAKKSPKTTFNTDKFIDGLSEDLQVKFGELLNSEGSLTDAVLALVKFSRNKSETVKSAKVSVSDEIKTLVTAILDYNSQQTENTKCVVPTYALINKIAAKFLNKSLAKVTVDSVLNDLNDDITSRLATKEITGLNLGNWNGKYHRKDLDTVIDSIVTILNSY